MRKFSDGKKITHYTAKIILIFPNTVFSLNIQADRPEQCRPISDTIARDVWSGFPLFVTHPLPPPYTPRHLHPTQPHF